MAHKMQALAAYSPRVEYNDTTDSEELAAYISRGTALNASEIYAVLREFLDAILFFCRKGSPIKLENVGIFKPVIKADGSFRLRFRMDPDVRRGINAEGSFSGTILNRENIGMSMDEFIEMWDAEHPDDPVVDDE